MRTANALTSAALTLFFLFSAGCGECEDGSYHDETTCRCESGEVIQKCIDAMSAGSGGASGTGGAGATSGNGGAGGSGGDGGTSGAGATSGDGGSGGVSDINDLSSCETWTAIEGNTSVTASLSIGDAHCYTFETPEVGNIRFTISNADQTPLVELIADDGDSYLQSEEVIASNSSYGTRPTEISAILPRQQFTVRVSSGAGSFTLNTRFESHQSESPIVDPGEDPGGSHVIGVLADGPAAPLTGYVGPLDESDFYRIDLEDMGTLRLTLTAYDAVPLTSIIHDDGDGVVQESEAIVSNFSYGARPTEIGKILPSGTYYVRVDAATTTYTLNITFDAFGTSASDDGAEDTLSSALALGSLTTASLVTSGYVGPLDSVDIYHFEIPDSSPVTINILDASATPLVEIIADTGDGVPQTSEIVASNFSYGGRPTQLVWSPAGAGTYYLRIGSAETLYTANLTRMLP